jgi:alcohol dehydrogenase
MAFANAPVGAVHALAYPIGSHFHIPHGLSNSLVLPAVLRFNNGDMNARKLYSQVVPIAFPELAQGGEADGEMLAHGFEKLALDLGIQTRLSEVGITEADLDLLSTEAMTQERLLPNNPRKVTLPDARAIYTSVL